MKKLAILLALLLFCGESVFAAESATNVPEQKFNDNRAVVSIQKQPANENAQKQTVKNNWFCVVVQVNGKIDDIGSTVQNNKQ